MKLTKINKIEASKLNNNLENPRIIRSEKFKKLVQSIKNFPEMLKIRPIVVNKDLVVLGGNMRLRACIEAGIKEVYIQEVNLSKEKEKEFIIKDNSSFGEWDWDILANEWNVEELKDWGVNIPKWEDTNFDSDIEDTGDYDYPDDENLDTSHVKMVQLFLNTKTEPKFKQYELKLREKYKTENLTDTVFHCIEKEFKNL
tara:strand:+ start:2107 stop:2703 length:597 start_codon:yes stop_codon:yes gene_type:complete